jgi:hypothetical protein
VSEPRDCYLRTLGLDSTEKDKDKRLAAFTRACERRDFEIELYWKRATYFWAFQVAIFAAFGLLWRAADAAAGDWSPITILLAALGILTALTHSLSVRGSGFWQQNWESHIDILENEFEGSLYKTVWLNKGKVSYSVARVNRSLADYFVVFWAMVFIYVVWRFLKAHSVEISPPDWWPVGYVVVVFLITLLGIFWLFGQTTDLSRGIIPRSDGADVQIQRRSRWCHRWRKRVSAESPPFIRRHAPGEDRL